MARPRKLNPVDALQARINDIKKIIDPAHIESLKAELKKLEDAVKFVGENAFLMEVFSSPTPTTKKKGGRPKGSGKKAVAKKVPAKTTGKKRGRPKGSKNKKAD